MAELLVMNIARKSGKDHFQVGDVVVVRPDGHGWGKSECPPVFKIVKHPGEPVESYEDLCQSWETIELVSIGGELEPVTQAIRRYKLHMEELPDIERATKSDIQAACYDKMGEKREAPWQLTLSKR